MKRFALLSVLLVIAISASGLAQIAVKITVIHASGKVTPYTGTAATVGDACGAAFRDATENHQGTTNLLAGDVIQIPEVVACNIRGNPSESGMVWPSDLKIVGKGPKSTTLNSADDFSLSGNGQVFQDLTLDFDNTCCKDSALINVSPTTGIFTLKNVNMITRKGCNGPGGVSVESGNALLDHVNLTSATLSIYSGSGGKITIRNSTVSAFCDNAVGGTGTVDMYDSQISNTKDNDDSTLYPMGGTLNIYAGTSIVAASGSRSIACNGDTVTVNLYPGSHLSGTIDNKGGCKVNNIPPPK